ncbi:MAG TPA: phosphoglycerate transporter, partial [Candidatus Gallacutalibacter pullistercoris]|nr:phosphoglycerate transporter [Candidatus Gallacutalibacter pullistercoris]
MKVGILCAGDGETAPFLSMLTEHTVEEKAKLKFYQGKIGNA